MRAAPTLGAYCELGGAVVGTSTNVLVAGEYTRLVLESKLAVRPCDRA